MTSGALAEIVLHETRTKHVTSATIPASCLLVVRLTDTTNHHSLWGPFFQQARQFTYNAYESQHAGLVV